MEYFRRRALHAQTVFNTTVSAKRTRPTLVKQLFKLRVTLHACKENDPVRVKKKRAMMSACASNQA